MDRLNATVAREDIRASCDIHRARSTADIMTVCVTMAPVWCNSAD
ncbi:hypothetical protein [Achromobacter insolitus]|nr:hypothetical protein [Achromobacter insolitus]